MEFAQVHYIDTSMIETQFKDHKQPILRLLIENSSSLVMVSKFGLYYTQIFQHTSMHLETKAGRFIGKKSNAYSFITRLVLLVTDAQSTLYALKNCSWQNERDFIAN